MKKKLSGNNKTSKFQVTWKAFLRNTEALRVKKDVVAFRSHDYPCAVNLWTLSAGQSIGELDHAPYTCQSSATTCNKNIGYIEQIL